MLVELRHAGTESLINRVSLIEPPHPGSWFELDGVSYMVMQRQHRYSLKGGKYKISAIALFVKLQKQPPDAVAWRHGWVIGDPTCRFNAQSPLLRCVVWPDGPCHHCSHYQTR